MELLEQIRKVHEANCRAYGSQPVALARRVSVKSGLPSTGCSEKPPTGMLAPASMPVGLQLPASDLDLLGLGPLGEGAPIMAELAERLHDRGSRVERS